MSILVVESIVSGILAILMFLLPPRWVAKIATFVLGVRVPALERQRFSAIVRARTTDDDAATQVSKPRSRSLLVAFAGGALQIGGQTRREFVNSTADLDCDRLFVTDPSNAWYTDAGFAMQLEEIVREFRHVVFLGNCLGATGALRFAHLANHVVCINPDIDVANHSDWRIRFAASRIVDAANERTQFVSRLVRSVSQCGGTVRVYVDSVPSHKREARLLQTLLEREALSVVDLQVVHCDSVGGGEKLARNLRDSGELIRALREFLSTAAS
jgi:hypothetical protein